MENGKVKYNQIDSLSEIEKQALDLINNGTRKDIRNFFKEHFENDYSSFTEFQLDIIQKAKGNTKINNTNFQSALDEAFVNSTIYDVETYRKSKELADKYFSHLGKTKETQDMILDFIANGKEIDADKFIKANAKYFESVNVNHGLYAFPDDLYVVKGNTDNPLKRIDENIKDIINNSEMELSLSSTDYAIGPIGVSGKTKPIVYHTNDLRSHLEFTPDGKKRVYQPNNSRINGTIVDIIDGIERESLVDYFSKHDELIGKGLDIESMWVKEDFYFKNKDYVLSLMQKYKINNLDLIHASENTEKIQKQNIERLNIKDLIKNSAPDMEKPLTINEQYARLINFHYNKFSSETKHALEYWNPISAKQYKINISSKPDIALRFTSDNVKKNLYDIAFHQNKAQAYLFRQNDVLFLAAHGYEDGKIHFNKAISVKEFLDEIEKFDYIPEDIKKIYTIDCFGGVQKQSTTARGIPIESIHTSNKTILNSVSALNDNEIAFNIDNKNVSLNYKEDALRNKFYLAEEVMDAQKINDFFDRKITAQEAYAKYGPDDDRFYIVQGLDPEEQKKKINELNSKRKPQKLPDYTAEDARLDKMLDEDKAYVEKIQKILNKQHKYKYKKGPKLKEKTVENTIKKHRYKPVKGPKLKEETTENVVKQPKQHKPKEKQKLKTKSLSGSGKTALAIVAAITATIVVGKIISDDDDEQENKKKRRKKEPLQRTISNDEYKQQQYLNNQYAAQMAKDISTYRYGKHMTGFVNC